MKAKILIFAVLTLIVFSCSTTTYLNLTQTYPEYIENELNNVKKDAGFGVEVSLLFNNAVEVNGELLSVRDSVIVLCSEYAATEEELNKLQYPILLFNSNEIQQLTIEGSSWTLIGIGAGAVVAYLIAAYAWSGGFGEGGTKEEDDKVMGTTSLLMILGVAAGWGAGYALSTEEYVLQEIPPDYDWSILKPLARYLDEEPEYLKAIK